MPLLQIDLDRSPAARRKNLPNGYQLVKQRQSAELERFNLDVFKREFSENALSQARYAELYLGVSEEILGHAEFHNAVDKSNKKIDRFLLALNVNGKLWNFRSNLRFSWLQDGTQAQVVRRDYWARSTVDDRPTLADFSRAAELTVTIDAVYSGEQQGYYPAARTAFDALGLGSYNFNTSMRFLQEAIALEALCSASDTEVTHRVATTCAILVAAGSEEREKVYKEAKRLYSIRSRIIHGSGKRATIQELKDIEQLTRKILRRILVDTILPKYKTRLEQSDFLLRLSLEKDSA